MSAVQENAVNLAGELTLRMVGEVQEQLRQAVADNQVVGIDGTEITEIDISVVQVLIAAFKSAAAADKRLSVSFSAGGALDQALKRAGFLAPQGEPLHPEGALWARV